MFARIDDDKDFQKVIMNEHHIQSKLLFDDANDRQKLKLIILSKW